MALLGFTFLDKGSAIDQNRTPLRRYTFKSDVINQQYIVEILSLKHSIYVVQFYLKSHRLSGKRFNLLISTQNGKNNKNAFMVLNTITNICLEIIKNNKKASFGFMGAPTSKESNPKRNKSNINLDKTIKNTKRHRVYSLYVKRYFPPSKFTHIEFNQSSCYLLSNIANSDLNLDLINDYHNEIILEKIS